MSALCKVSNIGGAMDDVVIDIFYKGATS